MESTNYKYFILVRLFKGWRDSLTTFEDCCKIYYSMRIEMRTMDFGEGDNWIQTSWKALHEVIPLDIIFNQLQPGQDPSFLIEKLPFDILLKTGITRTELIKLNERLRVVPPVKSDETEQMNWVTKFKSALDEFDEVIELPKK